MGTHPIFESDFDCLTETNTHRVSAVTMGSSFRSYVWDPPLILGQIATVQCIYYVSLGFILTLASWVFGLPPSLSYMFDSNILHLSNYTNTLVVTCHAISALGGSVALWYFVKRAKQCLDFTCTMHLIHLIGCVIYRGFPSTVSWWLIQLVCITVMVVMGEYLCMRTEMREIPLLGGTRHNV